MESGMSGECNIERGTSSSLGVALSQLTGWLQGSDPTLERLRIFRELSLQKNTSLHVLSMSNLFAHAHNCRKPFAHHFFPSCYQNHRTAVIAGHGDAHLQLHGPTA